MRKDYPDDEEKPCGICGKFSDDCTCYDCPTCHNIGDPKCKTEHGFVPPDDVRFTDAQFTENDLEKFATQEYKNAHNIPSINIRDNVIGIVFPSKPNKKVTETLHSLGAYGSITAKIWHIDLVKLLTE